MLPLLTKASLKEQNAKGLASTGSLNITVSHQEQLVRRGVSPNEQRMTVALAGELVMGT